MSDSKTEHALFQSITDDGSRWLFVILPDNQWAITCNDEYVASGTSEYASIHTGMKKYLSLVRDEVKQAAQEYSTMNTEPA